MFNTGNGWNTSSAPSSSRPIPRGPLFSSSVTQATQTAAAAAASPDLSADMTNLQVQSGGSGGHAAAAAPVPAVVNPALFEFNMEGTRRLLASSGVSAQCAKAAKAKKSSTFSADNVEPPFDLSRHTLASQVVKEKAVFTPLDDPEEKCGVCMFKLVEEGVFDEFDHEEEDEDKDDEVWSLSSMSGDEEEQPKKEKKLPVREPESKAPRAPKMPRKHFGVFQVCRHRFHYACLKELLSKTPEHVQCPVCNAIYGVKMGTQPKGGTMTVTRSEAKLPGYEDDHECQGTIQIMYNFQVGIQDESGPSPGQRYGLQGFPRVAYLPATPKGEKVLRLLQRSFDRRVTFTIGRSATTGSDNVVTWNDIHHKTGHSGAYGYPDPKYLDRVMLELAQHGIVEK